MKRSPSVIRPQEIPATGSLNGHAGIHKSKGGTADGSLGGGAVGGQNLGNKTEGIGELLLVGNYRNESSFGKGAVTDLAAAGPRLGRVSPTE